MRTASILGTALLVLFAPKPALRAQTAPLDAFRALRTADSLYEAGDRAAAVPGYETVVAHDSLHARAWYRLGRGLVDRERWAEAADAFERAHRIGYRERWWIALQIAEIRLRLGQREAALDWIDASLAERNEERPSLAEELPSLVGEPRFDHWVAAAPDSLDRVAGWRHDLAYLVEEARRLHAHPDRPAWSPRFEALADSIHDGIPAMDDGEVALALHRLLILLGDGHTGTYPFLPNDRGVEFPNLPVVLYRFEDGYRVVDGVGPGEPLIGLRVTAIGDLDPDEVLRRLDPYINQDNAITPLWLGIRFYMPSTRFLQAVGAADSIGAVTLTVVEPGGGVRRVTLPVTDHTFPRKLRHPATATAEPPLWLRDVDTNYRTVPLPDFDAVYVPFNQVRDTEGGPSLAAFADSLRASLERTGASNLIVDVRHNNGGNAGLLSPLLRTLVWWEQDDPGHTIWVLTGRNTFSATQIFIARLERWTDAVFVGERSSSRPNFTGEETSVRLPWSGIRGSVSSRYNQESDPNDDRAWIDPDLRVPLTSADYLAGRDPVMEAVERAIAEGPGR